MVVAGKFIKDNGKLARSIPHHFYAVITCDIVDFTSTPSSTQVYSVVALNAILTETLNKFRLQEGRDYHRIMAGDAAIICLNVDANKKIHELGIEILLEIKNRLVNYNTQRDGDFPAIELRYGAHHGENFFFEPNKKLGIDRPNMFGEAVNTAWRLMTVADPGDILISEPFLKKLNDSENSKYKDDFGLLGALQLKGVDDQVAYIYKGQSDEYYFPARPVADTLVFDKEVCLLRDISKHISQLLPTYFQKSVCLRASLLLKDAGYFYATHRVEEHAIKPGKKQCLPANKGLPALAYDTQTYYIIPYLDTKWRDEKGFNRYIKQINEYIADDSYHFASGDRSYFGRKCGAYMSMPILPYGAVGTDRPRGVVSVDFFHPLLTSRTAASASADVQDFISHATAMTTPAMYELSRHLTQDTIMNNIKKYRKG